MNHRKVKQQFSKGNDQNLLKACSAVHAAVFLQTVPRVQCLWQAHPLRSHRLSMSFGRLVRVPENLHKVRLSPDECIYIYMYIYI